MLQGAEAFELADYPAQHVGYRFTNAAGVKALAARVAGCHAADVPYNMAFSSKGFAYLFPRTKAQPEGTWHTYGERLGGFEMSGIFTSYQEATYARLDEVSVRSMVREATVKPPPPA